MALTETRPSPQTQAQFAAPGENAGSVERVIGSGDHLTIGRTFIVAALFFGTLSALGLALSGVDTATENKFLGDSAALVWNSSVIGIILAGALPLLIGLAIYLIPLQVGSAAISFPRSAALSLWTWVIGVLIFAASAVTDGGVGGADADSAKLGNLAVGLMIVALLGATVSIVTTVLTHRPVGMSLARVPLFSWSMLIAAPIWILNLSAALAGVVLGYVSEANAAGLTENYDMMIAGLWKAPSVYMLAIPVLGIAGDVTAKVATRRITAYGAAQGLIAAYGVLSFGVWAASTRAVASGAWDHNPTADQTLIFAGWVVLPGLFVLALLGLYGDTIRRSKLRLSAAGVAGPLSLVLVLGGVLSAALQVVDTLGKGNLVGFGTEQLGVGQGLFLIAAALCGAVGGTAFWGEKLWGHSSDKLARPSVGLVFAGGGLLGTIAVVQGVLEASEPSTVLYGAMVAITAALLMLGLLIGLLSALGAASAGHADPTADDSTGLTLEWAFASPPAPAGAGFSVPAVSSPYPLLDLREGPDSSDKESN
ncbi:MAG: cbb3-type cytochrome c oxidase subunit I [Microthrixaceae bacterium]